jgi:hypothetical protein
MISGALLKLYLHLWQWFRLVFGREHSQFVMAMSNRLIMNYFVPALVIVVLVAGTGVNARLILFGA